jgi:hypothetical protein
MRRISGRSAESGRLLVASGQRPVVSGRWPVVGDRVASGLVDQCDRQCRCRVASGW